MLKWVKNSKSRIKTELRLLRILKFSSVDFPMKLVRSKSKLSLTSLQTQSSSFPNIKTQEDVLVMGMSSFPPKNNSNKLWKKIDNTLDRDMSISNQQKAKNQFRSLRKRLSLLDVKCYSLKIYLMPSQSNN